MRGFARSEATSDDLGAAVADAPAAPPRPATTRPEGIYGQYNTMAIAAFAVAITGLFPVAFVLAVIALRQIRERGQPGRGAAVAALVISLVGMAIFGIIVAVAWQALDSLQMGP